MTSYFLMRCFEHVERPGDCLRRMDGVLKSKSPGGVIIIAFGPLFHSPFGDHLNRFFRFRIPWAGVLFSEDALMRLRREFWRPVADEAESFEDTREGLNKMKFSEFLRYVEEMGWITERLIVNPQLKRWPALWRLSNLLLRAPLLRDYLAASYMRFTGGHRWQGSRAPRPQVPARRTARCQPEGSGMDGPMAASTCST